MHVLSVNGLVKNYGRRRVVDGVSFAVEPGEIRADKHDIFRSRQRVRGRERHSRSQVTATLALEIQTRPRKVLEGGMGGVRLAPKLERGQPGDHDPA